MIFRTGQLARVEIESSIERHLENELGYPVRTFVRTSVELLAVTRYGMGLRSHSERAPSKDNERVRGATDPSTYVIFLKKPPDEQVRKALHELESDMDQFDVVGTEVYWHIRGKLSESPVFGQGIESAFETGGTTMRNFTSVRKLQKKLEAPSQHQSSEN